MTLRAISITVSLLFSDLFPGFSLDILRQSHSDELFSSPFLPDHFFLCILIDIRDPCGASRMKTSWCAHLAFLTRLFALASPVLGLLCCSSFPWIPNLILFIHQLLFSMKQVSKSYQMTAQYPISFTNTQDVTLSKCVCNMSSLIVFHGGFYN